MTANDRSNIMANSFKNPTKLGIISVLLQKGEMTVTQMSKIIGTTKSNLYQAIAELVSDGLVNPPDVRVNKNYVEKFYTIKEETFSEVSAEEWKKKVSSLQPDELRDLLVSFLRAQSVVLRIMAEEIALSDTEHIQKLSELMKMEMVFSSYSKLSHSSYLKIASPLKNLLEELGKIESNDAVAESPNTLIVIGLPSINLLNEIKH
jgi:predicted ArsR family transcriptional regulator